VTRGIETIARGESSRIAEAQNVVVRTQLEWRALWAAHAGSESAAPAVDFDRRIVTAVFLGSRPSAGSGVSIAGYRRQDAFLEMLVEEHQSRKPIADITGERPGDPSGEPPTSRTERPVSRAYHIVSVPRFDGDVRFVDADSAPQPVLAAKPVESNGRSSHGVSSTGLEPQMAGALAYLAGPLSGALLLSIERTSQFVRFHAWQALLALGAVGGLAIGCLGLAFVLLVFSPTLFRALLWTSAAVAVLWLALWGVCLFQALRGEQWKLPIAGAYAERFAR
jgi:uncharacterized membrane protein